MAAIDDIILAKKDYQIALNAQKMREIFSEFLIGYAGGLTPALKTYESIIGLTSINNTSNKNANSLKGIGHLVNLSGILFSGNPLIVEIPDISACTKIAELYLNTNALTALPSLANQKLLATLNCEANSIAAINIVSNLELVSLTAYENRISSITDLYLHTKLKTIFLSANLLTTIGDVTNLKALELLRLDGNQFSTASIDSLLTKLNAIVQWQIANGGRKLTTVRLDGALMGIPTGGNSNGNVVALVAAGVAVTIRTV